MTLGDKSLIDKDVKEDYSLTGASHVLALSGLHLTILYGLLVFLLGRCERLFPRLFRRAVCEILILLILWGYVILVGMSSSVIRSAVMLTIYSFVTLLNRARLSVNTLALTAIILLVYQSLPTFRYKFSVVIYFCMVHSTVLFTYIRANTFRERKATVACQVGVGDDCCIMRSPIRYSSFDCILFWKGVYSFCN